MPGRVVSQYAKDIEALGLVKIDSARCGRWAWWPSASTASSATLVSGSDGLFPMTTPEVFRTISAADTACVFQVESRAQMQGCPRHGRSALEDLVVQVAIIRPGPVQGNAVHLNTSAGAPGREPVTYSIPAWSRSCPTPWA